MANDLRSAELENQFEEELQIFAREVGILCALESGGKVEPQEAYQKIKASWKKLKGINKSLQKPAARRTGNGAESVF